jgi:exonuclease III
MDLKSQTDSNTVVLGDFNTHLSLIYKSCRQKKINKEILQPNDIIDKIELTDVYRIVHLAIAQYTYFSAAHGIFSKIDHILDTKQISTNIRKLK